MDKANMANNSKTVRVYDTRYRTIPNFSNYGISAYGEVINLTTKMMITPKDYDHWSGRVTLYNYNGSTGKRESKTVNILDLLRLTYSKSWTNQIVNKYSPLTCS